MLNIQKVEGAQIEMFKVGDFVALNRKPFSVFIVTRIYDNDFMAVGTYDVLDGMIFNEYKVK